MMASSLTSQFSSTSCAVQPDALVDLPKEPHVKESWRRTALIAAKVIAAGMLFAGAAAGLGMLLQSGGTRLINYGDQEKIAHLAGVIVKAVGDKLFWIGKYSFYSISVPIYAITWVIPKWAVTRGIPQGIVLAHRYVLIPLSKGIVRGIHVINLAVCKIAQAIYTDIMCPFARMMAGFSKWFWHAVLIPLSQGIVQGFRGIHQATMKTIQVIYTYLLKPLGYAVLHASVWIGKAVILPVCKGLIEVSKIVGDSLVQLAQVIYNSVILPTGKLSAMAFRSASAGSAHLIHAVLEAGCSIAKAVREAFVQLSGILNFNLRSLKSFV
jgi:hypothetical protein